MILIVGLGNPGQEYEDTRHNFGFRAVELLAKDLMADEFKLDKRKNTEIASGMITFPGQKKHVRFALAKPQTFMNNSGRAVQALVDYYRIRPEDQLWVIHDDLDVDLGKIRIRVSGSSAGQKGVQSIIDTLKTDRFIRFRMGIRTDKCEKVPAEKYVLERFSKEESETVKSEINELRDIILEALDKGVIERTI
jgi:PTH1 family peptidyl-tRNA hydrolase